MHKVDIENQQGMELQLKDVIKILIQDSEKKPELSLDHIYFYPEMRKTLSFQIQKITHISKDGYLINIQDITPLKDYEALKKTFEQKTLYFSQIAHDLRAPVNTVLTLN